eukprot:Awhi_evm1s10519
MIRLSIEQVTSLKPKFGSHLQGSDTIFVKEKIQATSKEVSTNNDDNSYHEHNRILEYNYDGKIDTKRMMHLPKTKVLELTESHGNIPSISQRKKRKRVKTSNEVLKGCNVTICDDNVVSLKLLSTMLTKLGCTVRVFENPRNLLTTFKQSLLKKIERKNYKERALSSEGVDNTNDNNNNNNNNNNDNNSNDNNVDYGDDDLEFEIILLDIYMPELDGFDVAKAIRHMELEYHQLMLPSASSIPRVPSSSSTSLFTNTCPLELSEKIKDSKYKGTYIMALSATSRVDDRVKALEECQMNFFMNKPFELSDLADLLTDIKEKRERLNKKVEETENDYKSGA